MPGSPETCGWKPYRERKSWGFKKGLDTCGRGLRVFMESFTSSRGLRHTAPFSSSINEDNEIVFD